MITCKLIDEHIVYKHVHVYIRDLSDEPCRVKK